MYAPVKYYLSRNTGMLISTSVLSCSQCALDNVLYKAAPTFS